MGIIMLDLTITPKFLVSKTITMLVPKGTTIRGGPSSDNGTPLRSRDRFTSSENGALHRSTLEWEWKRSRCSYRGCDHGEVSDEGKGVAGAGHRVSAERVNAGTEAADVKTPPASTCGQL